MVNQSKLVAILASLLALGFTRSLQDAPASFTNTETPEELPYSSDPDAQYIVTCMNQYTEDYKFCNVGNQNSLPDTGYRGYGWCCPTNSTHVNCTESETVQCTSGSKSKQGEPLYLSYWPGMTNEVCNRTSETLIATTELQTLEANNIVLAERVYTEVGENSVYESCHYIIEVPEHMYFDDGYFELTVNSLDKTNLFIYEGSDRHNATDYIEGNVTAVPGAPYRLSITSKIVVVLQTVNNGNSGSGSFSFKVIGAEYPTWEVPFLGEDTWKWNLAFVLFLAIPCLLCVLINVIICRFCCSQESEEAPPKQNRVVVEPPKRKEDQIQRFSESDLDSEHDEDRNQRFGPSAEDDLEGIRQDQTEITRVNQDDSNRRIASPANADLETDIQHRKSLVAGGKLQNEEDFVKSIEDESEENYERDDESQYEEQNTQIPVPGTANARIESEESKQSSPYRSYVSKQIDYPEAQRQSPNTFQADYNRQPTNPFPTNRTNHTFQTQQVIADDNSQRFIVAGGASQIGSAKEDQPVSFYRFKKKQQQELISEMYRDPFDPNVEITVQSVRDSRNMPLGGSNANAGTGRGQY